MRISTRTIYENATNQLNSLQSQLARTQNQLSANTRILTAADDPIAAARALEVTQSQSLNTQYATNRNSATSALALVEQALNEGGNRVMDVQTLLVQAGNGALNKSDREKIAGEIEARMQDLLGVANSTDGSGHYLFSGYRSTTVPFVEVEGGADYQGDQGQRMLQVGASRTLAISETGNAVFEGARTGNGSYQTVMAAGNKGSAVATSGSVVDPSLLNGHAYTLSFQQTGTPAATTYTVTDNTTDPPEQLVSGKPYIEGQKITVGAVSFDVKGSPADGDSFEVKPSQKESVFATLSNLVTALRTSTDDEAGRAALTNKLTVAGENLGSALDNILSARASVGSRMKEVDYLESAGADLGVQYASTLSKLQDLDVVKAISDFSTQQSTLQAAQVSFKTMSGLSLFNYIS